jgi:predicted component of type VI protein secretion system
MAGLGGDNRGGRTRRRQLDISHITATALWFENSPGFPMLIQILLRDPRSGTERKYELDQSPVRIGRNPLNNIVLEGNFVSGWHGIIRFDNTGTFYFDLGSTNGTCLDGKKLPKNTAIPVLQPTRFTIWMFELMVIPGQSGSLLVSQSQPPLAGTSAGSGRSTEVYPPGALPQTASQPHSPARVVSVGGRSPTPPPPTSATGRPPSSPPAPAAAPIPDRLIRCLRIIGAFSEAFMGLKKGYEQFGAEVGVRPLTGTTPLHRARTSQEIVEYLLNSSVDPEVCARDLNAVFADMGIHDVALMEGITQSVRGLLAKLDPNTLDVKTTSSLFSGGKAKTRWNEYAEQFGNLLAEDAALHAEIFGEEFAAAYASVALGDDKPPTDDGD